MNARQLGAAVRNALSDVILADWYPQEPYEVKIKPGLGTACWSYLPPHRIYIGTEILKRIRDDLDEADLFHYIGSYLHHEFGHALHTEKNLKAIKPALKAMECPFGLFNLFEDARIEELWRTKTGRRFRWAELEKCECFDSPSPADVLFVLIQGEGRLPESLSTVHTESYELLERVEHFYRRALAAPDTFGLMPVLKDWLNEFGGDVSPYFRFLEDGNDNAELELAQALQEGGLNEFDADALSLDAFAGNGKGGESGSQSVVDRVHSELLSDNRQELAMDVAQRLAAKFERYLSSPARRNYSHEPSKRMSQWRASAGRPAYGHLTTLAARKRSICLIVDCSGSMQEQIGNARTLALVLNLLSQQGKVGGHIVLSAIISGGVAVSQAFEFPVSHDVVERIHGFGEGEGLRSALMVHQQKVKTADDVFVFTDARITDEPINVAGLRQQGIAVCGLYVGDYEESNAHLAEHFERFVVRESMAALIDALLSK